jgi:D-arabinose 1-dehydrogenase-like Zn-dependent alcohol dehydrogenase
MWYSRRGWKSCLWNNIKNGDRVVVHNKVFDGTCDMCLNRLDMICRNGRLIGAITNGVLQSISQYLRGMCLKYPGDIDWD